MRGGSTNRALCGWAVLPVIHSLPAPFSGGLMCRKIIWVGIIFSALYFGGHFVYWYFVDATSPVVYQEMTDQERAEHKRLLKKHGDYPVHYYSDKPEQKFFTKDGRIYRWM
jgi:hypothetical protein